MCHQEAVRIAEHSVLEGVQGIGISDAMKRQARVGVEGIRTAWTNCP